MFVSATRLCACVRSRDIPEDAVRGFCQRFGIKDGSVVLLSLGLTAMSYKAEGLKLLIRSLKRVKEEFPNILLVATRDGRYLDELKDLAKEEGLESSRSSGQSHQSGSRRNHLRRVIHYETF